MAVAPRWAAKVLQASKALANEAFRPREQQTTLIRVNTSGLGRTEDLMMFKSAAASVSCGMTH